MSTILYREATSEDIPFLAKIRAKNSGTEEGWTNRITGYLEGTIHPQQALKPRIIYVALDGSSIIGFIAGHLTRRLECEGELEWIDVAEGYRRAGIASELVRVLAKWFIRQSVHKICVDPGNEAARKFYRSNGAENLNQHWMYWDDIRDVL